MLVPGASLLTDTLSGRISTIAAEIDAKAQAEVGSIAESIQQLQDEGRALAANLEREDSAVKRLEELRPVQLEIARATAVLQRTSSEMMDAMETLEKASEKLRALVTMR